MRKYFKYSPVLISNIYPFIGVLFLHWDLFGILFVFSVQTIMIGYFMVVRSIIVRSEIPTPGVKLLYSFMGLIMFGILLFGLLMSFLNIFAESKGIEMLTIMGTLTQVTKTSVSNLGFSLIYYFCIEAYELSQHKPVINSDLNALQFYTDSFGRFCSAVGLMALLGVLATKFYVPLMPSLVIFLIIKIPIDQFWEKRTKILTSKV